LSLNNLTSVDKIRSMVLIKTLRHFIECWAVLKWTRENVCF